MERDSQKLAADRVTKWRQQIRAEQNNTLNHKWNYHRKGSSKRPSHSF